MVLAVGSGSCCRLHMSRHVSCIQLWFYRHTCIAAPLSSVDVCLLTYDTKLDGLHDINGGIQEFISMTYYARVLVTTPLGGMLLVYRSSPHQAHNPHACYK